MKKDISSAVNHYFVPFDELMPILQDQLNNGRKVRFSPRGVSMLPMIRQGIDSVEVSAVQGQLKKYDIAFYRRDNGQYILHRVVGVGKTYTCIGDNQFMFEDGVRQDQLIAVVTSFSRGRNDYSVNHPIYLLYCRIWHYSRKTRWFIKRAVGYVKRHMRNLFSRLEK